MRETGERFVCDRCKKEVFKHNTCSYADNYPTNWGVHLYVDSEGTTCENHLCDDCYGTYNVMIADFMALREIKVVK